MLTHWRISNFKSIRKSVALDIAPLTIFCGANSSGKSALIKSILMVSQTLRSSAWEEALVLNGELVQLGDLQEILHYGFNNLEMNIEFHLKNDKADKIIANTSFSAYKPQRNKVNEKLFIRVTKTKVKVIKDVANNETIELVWQPSILKKAEIKNVNPIIEEQIEKGLFNYEIIQPKITELSREFFMSEIISSSLKNFLPKQLLTKVRSDIRDITFEIEQITQAILKLIKQNRPGAYIDLNHKLSDVAKFAFEVVGKRLRIREDKELIDKDFKYKETLKQISYWPGDLTIRECVDIIKEKLDYSQIGDLSRRLRGSLIEVQKDMQTRFPSIEKSTVETTTYPLKYSDVMESVINILGYSLYYLGPLRDDPKVIYATPISPSQKDVGLKGEFTAAMLDIYGDKKLTYPLPPEEHFDGNYNLKNGTLNEALRIWLKRMQLAESYQTVETSKVGYRFSVYQDGLKKQLDLMSVGVGVSQILPTLVMALLAPKYSILIFEQPEVHLHPKVQSLLGDFFLGIISCSKQCIIETHSEHLINRIRRRIAEDQNNKLIKLLSIYFVERYNSVSHFRKVKPNEYGAILEWPKGFFDEVEIESNEILRASLEKRRKIHGN